MVALTGVLGGRTLPRSSERWRGCGAGLRGGARCAAERGGVRRGQKGPGGRRAWGPRWLTEGLTWLDPETLRAGRATCVRGRGGQGCGIVEFESAESAAEAINTLHLSEVCWTLLRPVNGNTVSFMLDLDPYGS